MLLSIVNGTFIVLLGLSLWVVMGLRRASPGLSARLQRALVRLHLKVYRATDGKLGGRIPASGPIVILTTTGRKTGRLRQTPLLYLPDGEDLVIVASNGGAGPHPAWYLNLQNERGARAEIPVHRAARGGRAFGVLAEEAHGEDRSRLWQRLTEMYPLYENYQRRTDRQIPVLRLHKQ